MLPPIKSVELPIFTVDISVSAQAPIERTAALLRPATTLFSGSPVQGAFVHAMAIVPPLDAVFVVMPEMAIGMAPVDDYSAIVPPGLVGMNDDPGRVNSPVRG